MARIRTIKPDFWTNERVMRCKPLTRLLFIGMWNFADDYGRMHYAPLSIKAKVFPNDEIDAASIKEMLAELNGNGLLIIYSADDREFIEITGWDHQKIDRRQISKIPAPFTPTADVSPEVTPTPADLPRYPPTPADSRRLTPTPAAVMEGNGGEKKEGGGDGGTREAGKSLLSEESFVLAGDILEAMGLEREHPISVGAPMTVQNWLNGGWNGEIILVAVKRAMQGRKGDPPGTLNYFEKAIARLHAEASRPLPKVELRQAETIQVVSNGTTPRAGSVVAAAKRFAENFERESRDDIEGDPSAVLRLPSR